MPCLPHTPSVNSFAARVAAVLGLIFLGVPFDAGAQEAASTRPLVEIFGVYEFGLSMSSIPVFAGSPDCGLFENGSHTAMSAGAGVVLPMNRSVLGAVELRGSFATGTARLEADPHERLYLPTVQSGTRELLTASHEYRLEDVWRSVRFDLMARIGSSAPVGIGVWLGHRFSSTIAQNDVLINEPLVRFEGGRVEQAMPGREPLSPTAFSYGVMLDARLHLHLSERVTFAPQLTLRADLSSLAREYAWRSYSAGVGAAILLDMFRHDTLPALRGAPVRDTVVVHDTAVESLNRASRLRASLELYGIDDQNHRLPAATIRVYEVLTRQRASLLDAVYFDRGASELPERYTRLTAGQSAAFSSDSLTGLGPMEMHYQALNIIGWRMRKRPAATLTLAGSVSKGESPAIARSRALAVRAYLREVWGIDSTRIVVAANATRTGTERTEDQRAERRRVAMTSDNPAILDPLIASTISRDFEPPLVALDPQFESDAGIRQWSVVLEHGGKEVGHLSSHDTGDAATLNMSWQIDEKRSDLANSFLSAALTVEDSAGVVATTRTQVPLVIERNLRTVDRYEQRGGREAVTYSLLAFAHNSAEVNRRNNAVLAEVVSGVRSGARINVVGYTDRTGTDAGNEALSQRRAAAVAGALRGMLKDAGIRNVAISVVGGGYEAGRFDNEVPEGRVLSREVDVVVEQAAHGDHR